MECPKCHTLLNDDQTVCPKCHKVLLLECPNCHSIGENPICQNCGYTILTKCSKCSKTVSTTQNKCPKCGMATSESLAMQECEIDEFASVVIQFTSLKKIRSLLKSQELYSKFFYKLKNMLLAQLKGHDGKFIIFNDTFVVNFNKELSFQTSTEKAVRLALKIINAFVDLNSNIITELSIPLNLHITITKKIAEKLQELPTIRNNIKTLTIKKNEKKYLKGFQIILDQYVCDSVNKHYKTDSLYTLEENGENIVFYEILLDSYVLPPTETVDEQELLPKQQAIASQKKVNNNQDAYSFKIFDINAKCKFEQSQTVNLISKLTTLNLDSNGKIISLKAEPENMPFTHDLTEFYKNNGYKVLKVTCTAETAYKPWGIFETLFRNYLNISHHNKFFNPCDLSPSVLKVFKPLIDLCLNKPVKAMSPEDARFAYMEAWGKFFSTLDKTVIIIENFENLDDTSIQTLELYFDKFKAVKPNFVFLTNNQTPVHSKIKSLLRTSVYTEISLCPSSMDDCLSTLKSDAADFIQSFYFEKIKENFDGSYLYFKNAFLYLIDTGIIIDFDNKLIIKSHKSVILPKDLSGLYKSRVKYLSKNPDISFIFAYASFLGERLDKQTLETLGIKDIDNNLNKLQASGFIQIFKDKYEFNNYSLVNSVISASLKQDAITFLAKNVIAQTGKGLDDTRMAIILGKMGLFKEEYLTLWKNSQFAIKTGDFDAYLKNCLGFLSIVEHIETDIAQEEIEENKKEVYQNILLCLYSYSPAKIYYIENILLMDALNNNDDEKIVKLSNLMLQGALISSNYTDAQKLLHNILSRMKEPTLKIDNTVNTKFFLLSLVNIEILYNIGNFRECIETSEEILSVLSPNVLDDIKPQSFSSNLFVSHILETLRLSTFAKLYLLDNDIEDFINRITTALEIELPEKDCILAIRDYLQGQTYSSGNIEEYSAYSKIIFLILQELSSLKDDYKKFAQNIYQAKLLALDIHQHELEWFCDLLIGYAYAKAGVPQKAELIYKDIIEKSEKSAIFNTLVIAQYLLAGLKSSLGKQKESFILINDALSIIQKYNNQSKILYALVEKLYIDTAENEQNPSVNIETERFKLEEFKNSLSRFITVEDEE